MNAAVQGEPIEPTWTPAPKPKEAQPKPLRPVVHLGLKDLVAQFAEESGVEFLPKLGRMHEGLQVYHFGLVSCAVDTAHETIFAQMNPKDPASWRVVSLDELLEENDSRLRRAG